LAPPSAARDLVVDVVSDFRRVYDRITTPSKCLGELSFGPTVAVGVRGIEERHAVVVVRAAQHRHGFGVGLLAPPPRGERPCAEPDLARRDVGPRKRAIPHAVLL